MSPASRVGAVLLAAGASRRFGEANKLLQEVDGRPLVARVAATLHAAGLDPIVAVLGTEAPRVRAALDGVSGVETVENPDHAEGMGTSIACGIRRLRETGDITAAVIALADMPYLKPETVTALRDTFALEEARTGVVVPVKDGRRGHPVLFARRYFDDLAALGGDVGARKVLAAAEDAVIEVETDDPGIFLDVDTPADLPAQG